MNYVNEIKGILFLEERAYKKVSKDKNSFKRYIISLFISWYIGLIISMFILNNQDYNIINTYTNNIYITISSIILTPFIVLLIDLLYYIIPYFIGKRFGGKTKNYLNFFTDTNYISPIFYFFIIISNAYLNLIALIWELFIIHRTYTYVLKLKRSKSNIAILLNIIFLGILIAGKIFISWGF